MPLTTHPIKAEAGSFILNGSHRSDTIVDAIQYADRNGGATIWRKEKFTPKNVGRYIVAVGPRGIVIGEGATLREKLNAVREVLAGTNEDTTIVGVGLWFDFARMIHIEPVCSFRSLFDAERFASALNEEYIWDRKEQKEIPM